jgi:hypothetical protein
MKIKLKCPKCKFRHTVADEYLQRYRVPACVCGCGEKMEIVVRREAKKKCTQSTK